MQEVFEKIKKNLVTELTFCSGYPNCSEYDYAYEVAMYDAQNKATAIVDRVVKEYNNGWIPVEERLPDDSEGTICCLVTCKSVDNEELEIKCAYFNKGFSDGWVSLYGVTAWQPLPEPYQPKGDKE